jgi:phosphohistidine phosphatase
MKTVLILRHAKSDWGAPDLADFDRPLAKRGLEDAPRMGQVLALFNLVPDKILSSPAQRAKQTAELVAKASGYCQAIQWEKLFYEGNPASLLTTLEELPDEVTRVLLIGHNPMLEETVALLCSPGFWENDRADGGWRMKIPTAGLVNLQFDIESWADLEPGGAILQWFIVPKLVRAIQGGKD